MENTREKRLEYIKRIEEIRGSHVITFLTSLRQNVPAQIEGDSVREFFDQLHLLPEKPVSNLDIFLVSNGGSGVVPWRLMALFREFSDKFSVLIPYRAYSAATLISIGADEIVMHPFGELGPIDPTVSNAFNPVDNINRLQGVSVEDVKAYITFVKNTVGITHEDELVQALNALTEKVHPLALGNVERFLSQSRMMARKILKTHMDDKDSHIIDDIIENLASKLYFHGHPINRKEAKDDLKLKVVTDLPPDLETTMWDLYEIYEKEFNNREIFNPPSLLFSQVDTNARENGPFTADVELLLTVLESTRLTSMCKVKRRYSTGVFQHGQHPAIREDVLELKWSRFLASAG